MKTKYILFIAFIIFTSCATKRVSTIVGREYDKSKNLTNYFVLPFGSTSIPGKWTKSRYNEVSKQQFFINDDSISIAIAFTPINNYEFNTNNSKKGFEFIQAFYEWDSEYFVNTLKLNREQIEVNKNQNYVIWRAYGEKDNATHDTYFLFGEKNGNANSFSILITDKWTKEEKINFLKEMYLNK